MLRFLTAGESHGRGLVVIVDGLPAGLPLDLDRLNALLHRRQGGYGRGRRMAIESDRAEVQSGVRPGRTTGGPVALLITNRDWVNWQRTMHTGAEMPDDATGANRAPVVRPRPGHADLAGALKYEHDDVRDVLERASARETAARVAAGAVAKLLLAELGVSILSHVIQMGPVRSTTAGRPTPADLARVDESPVRCFDASAEAAMIDEVKAAAKDGDSLGGVVEVLGYGVPIGLGSHVHWDRKIDAALAQAMMSIQAVKGVEIGEAFDVAGRRGSVAHDAIVWDVEANDYRRESALAGGTEGGMTTGELLVVRAAMKPLATLNQPTLKTVDVITKEATVSFKERTDVTAVPAMGVVGETMVALVLAAEAQRKFGGDSVAEFVRNADAFRASLS